MKRHVRVGILSTTLLWTPFLAVVSVAASKAPEAVMPVASSVPITIAPGYSKQTFVEKSGAVVTVTGPSSVTVTFSGSAGAMDLTATLPTPSKTATALALASAQAPPSMYDMALADGMSSADAQSFASGFDDSGPSTSMSPSAYITPRGLSAPSAAVSSQVGSGVRTVVASTTQPYDSTCLDEKSSDGREYSHNCLIRYLTYAYNGNWYLANKMKGSGRSTDTGWFPARLTHLGLRTEYPAGNTTVDWAPTSTHTISATCTSSSATATDSKTGTQYTTTSDVCPDNYGPWEANNFLAFGSMWNGTEHSNDYEATVATSVVHSPATASAAAKLTATLSWKNY